MKKRLLVFVSVWMFVLIGGGCSSSSESAPKIPVLMYHHLSENEADWGGATISPAKFKEDMLYLKALGFTTILPEEVVAYQQKGTPLPEQPILITFDDGYKSNYTYAYPILKELQMKAVIHVIVATVGRDTLVDGTPITPHFSWEEAKEMTDSGLISIGHHTYDLHQLGDGKYGKGVAKLRNESTETYIERLKKDIKTGEEAIETHLHTKPIAFAYPYGLYTKESEQLLQELGYPVTFTVQKGVFHAKQSLSLLPRINVAQDVKSPVLMKTLLKKAKVEKEVPFDTITDPAERIQLLEKKAEVSF